MAEKQEDTSKGIVIGAIGGTVLTAAIATLLAARPAAAAPSEEKLDYLIAAQEIMVGLLGEIKGGINQLLEKEELPTMLQVTKQVPLTYTIGSLETIKIAEPSPLTGRITSVAMHFPDGCNALVHVAFGHGEVWVAPSEIDTYISLNDATPVFPTNEPIEKGEHLWAEIQNADGGNPHSISVIATLVGVE
ncbi:hypothetical protein ES708_09277 [subsurface metagenome]